jgi:hypothetical protein
MHFQLSYVAAVMRGCLTRRKYKCLQNEKESKASHNIVPGETRKNNAESRISHVSFISKDIYSFICSNLLMW